MHNLTCAACMGPVMSCCKPGWQIGGGALIGPDGTVLPELCCCSPPTEPAPPPTSSCRQPATTAAASRPTGGRGAPPEPFHRQHQQALRDDKILCTQLRLGPGAGAGDQMYRCCCASLDGCAWSAKAAVAGHGLTNWFSHCFAYAADACMHRLDGMPMVGWQVARHQLRLSGLTPPAQGSIDLELSGY